MRPERGVGEEVWDRRRHRGSRHQGIESVWKLARERRLRWDLRCGMEAVARRIIDANANRAREGLRVLDDLARFGLDHAALAGDFKSLRHDLAEAIRSVPSLAADLIVDRDTPNDVGTALSTPGEMRRESVASVADANASRVAEALRSIEESAKLLDAPTLAGAIEALRYRVYDAHQRLMLAIGARHARRQWRLCVLITESLCTHHAWDVVARQALSAGADAIQLREKSLTDRELLARAGWLTRICSEHQASCVINDRPDIARLSGAHALHLGQSDLAIKDARAIVGFSTLIGVSTETMEEAREAARAGADVCGVGPMFATSTKLKPRLAGPEQLARYLADPVTACVPHLAIGGINASNIGALRAVGCAGVAVSSAVCSCPDPGGACRELLAAAPAAILPVHSSP